MSSDNIRYWVALKLVEDVGNIGFKNLVEFFGSPQAVFSAPVESMIRIPRISRKIASKIKEFKDWQKVERELVLAEKSNVSIVTIHDPLYPKLLLNIYDFPPLIYVKGNLKEDDTNVAVVGSRKADTYGRFITGRLCRELALKGITIVSGMARGIDSAAHEGALSGHGRTIAVLGSGIDVIYPPENKKLYDKIASNGAIITEYPFSTPPRAHNFPARNRIISGVSLGVVVVEAHEKSGSLITAKLALEQGKEIFAVPGSIDSPGSRGTHKLIKNGAKLVEDVYDILEEILPQVERHQPAKSFIDDQKIIESGNTEKGPALNAAEENILNLIGETPIQVDTLIENSGYNVHDLLTILLSLELQEYIKQLPGKEFIKC